MCEIRRRTKYSSLFSFPLLFSTCITSTHRRWLKDGQPVRTGDGVRILANGRRLVISRAQVSDTALFQCVAVNDAGEQERDFKVVVHGETDFSLTRTFR